MIEQVERDAKIGKLSQDAAVLQKVEILAALKKLGESLKPEEETYLQMNSSASLKQFERVSNELGQSMSQSVGQSAAQSVSQSEMVSQ